MLERVEDRTLLSTYRVNSLGDTGTGSGLSGDLRYVITQADQDPGSTIDFSVTGTIPLSSALPDLSANVTIDGPGPSALTVQGGGPSSQFSVFTIDPGVTAGISGVTITGGNASEGGGISNQGTLTLTGCTVTGNSASTEGGGIYSSGTLTLTGCTVTKNTASEGGGLFGSGTITLTDSTLDANSAQFAAGIFNNAALTVTNSTLSHNEAGSGPAGGLYNDNAGHATALVNCTLSGNTAARGGGGIENSSGTLELVNCTVAGNTATGGPGGGLYNYTSLSSNPGDVILTNTLVAGNTSDDVAGPVDSSSASNLIGNGSDLTGISDGSQGNQIGTTANPIDAKLGPLGDYGGPTFTVSLLAGSPAIDAGSNALAVDPTTKQPLTIDQRGAGRATNGLNAGSNVDIGSYEATSLYVVTSIDDTGEPGTLRAAVEWAGHNVNANPANNTSPAPNTINFDTSGVFATPQTILLTSRLEMRNENTQTYPNVALNGPGASALTLKGGGPSSDFSVLRLYQVNASISGLTITGGYTTDNGGGIENSYGTLTLTNCTLSGNSAQIGGGIFNYGTANLSNCTVSGNSATSGGGIFQDSFGTLTLANCTVFGNSANSGGVAVHHPIAGGGISNYGTLTLTNCSISKNSSTGEGDFDGGGGIENELTLSMTNCTLLGNAAARFGGGIQNSSSSGTATLTNCTISGNSAQIGGGIKSYSALNLTNCTLSGNTAKYGGGLCNFYSGIANLSDCTLSGNTATRDGGGIANLAFMPFYSTLILTNCALSGNTAQRGGGVFNGDLEKATLVNCTLTTNSATVDFGGGLSTETGGQTTLYNTLIAGNLFGASPSTTPGDVSGPVSNASAYNLIGDGDYLTGITDGLNGNQIGSSANPINARLDPLADNGGSTQTVALLAGSPAIDAGSNTLAIDPTTKQALTNDQRGHGFPRIVNNTVDIGAFEYQAPEPATQLVITTEPPSSVTAGTSFGLVVTAETASGSVATAFNGSVTLVLANNPSGAALGGTLTITAANGVATFSGLTLDRTGSGYTLQVSGNDLTATTSAITVTPGAAAQLVITTRPPASVTLGKSFGLTVSAEDAEGNVNSSFTGLVTVALATNPGGAKLGGDLTLAAVNGVATFSGLTLDKAGTGYRLQVTSNGLSSATTDAITATTGTPTHWVVTAEPPASITAGSDFGLIVSAEDGQGDVSPSFSGLVTVSLANNPGGAQLGGTLTASAVNGVATFSGLTLNKTGSGCTLHVSGSGLSGVTTTAITVTPGVATQLAITTQPPAAVNAGSGFGLAVAVLDQFGNLDTAFSGNLTVALASSPGGATLGGPVTVAAAGGLATFSGLTVNHVGNGDTLLVSGSGLVATRTSGFNVTSSPPSIIGERVLTAGKGRKKHVVGFELFFSAPLDPASAQNAANYIVIQNVRHGRKTITQPVGLQATYDNSANTVSLLLFVNAQFAKGGRLVVNASSTSGITNVYGTYLDGNNQGVAGDNGLFTVSPKGLGITR
jgi:predicted outer membrane repeat protein